MAIETKGTGTNENQESKNQNQNQDQDQNTQAITGRPTELISNGKRIRYTYDSHGRVLYKTTEPHNLKSKNQDRQALQLQYNANNELEKSLTTQYQGNKVIKILTEYHYDGFGRRIAKHSEIRHFTQYNNQLKQTRKTQHKHSHFLWDGDRPLQDYSDTHVYTTVYEQNSFAPVARLAWLRDDIPEPINDEADIVRNPYLKEEPKPTIAIYHYHNDQLGTPNELTNDQGKMVWLADFEAWGNVNKEVWREETLKPLQVEKAYLQPIRFQGQYIDEETGLHYNRFRYYDPDVGMFTSRDPIGLMGGDNVFAYAPNPTGWIDPLGLDYSMESLGAITGQAAASMNYMASKPSAPLPNNSRVHKFIQDLGYNISKGGNVEVEAGGTLVAVLGVRQSFGAAKDNTGRTCPTVTTCALIGPMIGAYTHAGASVSIGTLTPGSRTWSLSGTGTGTIGTGAGIGAAVSADGSLTGSLEGTVGAAGGAAAMICSKKVSKKCTG